MLKPGFSRWRFWTQPCDTSRCIALYIACTCMHSFCCTWREMADNSGKFFCWSSPNKFPKVESTSVGISGNQCSSHMFTHALRSGVLWAFADYPRQARCKKVGSLFAFTLECSIERYFWYVESDFLQITHHRPIWQTRQGLRAKVIGTISNARTGRNWNVVHSHRLLCARFTADSCALAAACLDNT